MSLQLGTELELKIVKQVHRWGYRLLLPSSLRLYNVSGRVSPSSPARGSPQSLHLLLSFANISKRA
eukprot:scaffold110270_cov62-Phaeocystis_antarctica.AAC.2